MMVLVIGHGYFAIILVQVDNYNISSNAKFPPNIWSQVAATTVRTTAIAVNHIINDETVDFTFHILILLLTLWTNYRKYGQRHK